MVERLGNQRSALRRAAQAILADREIGLHPHPETVAAGAEIDDFGTMELSLVAN